MTPLRHLLAFLLLATAASGNLYVPKAKLAGETVYVRLAKEAAIVSAVFEFEDWFTRDAKIVYFPIYANETDDPIQVLARAEFALDVGGTKLGVATPCEAPERFKKMPANPRVCWYSVNLDHVIEPETVDFDGRVAVRLTYTQPLIRGRFYYLPAIIGHGELDQKTRPWRYQMLARSSARVVQVLSKGTDYEQFGDSISACEERRLSSCAVLRTPERRR